MSLEIIKNDPETMEKIQSMLDDFCEFTGLAAVITDSLGNKFSNLSNFSSFCKVMRENENLCCISDKLGGELAAKIQDTCIYTCHAGIVDLAIPIIVNGEHIGTILAGQVRTQRKLLIDFSDKEMPWMDSEEMVKMYNQIPFISHEKLRKSAKILNILANYITEKISSYNALSVADTSVTDFENVVSELIEEISKVNYNKAKAMLKDIAHTFFSSGNHENMLLFKDIFKKKLASLGVAIPEDNVIEKYNNTSFIGEPLIGSYYFKVFDYVLEKIILQKRFRKINDMDWVTQYCNRFYYTKISTQDMAKFINISKDYFSRQFKKNTGITFTEFFARIKIREAKRLMKETDLSIVAISLELGYSEANYFTRVFKKYESISPKEYREKNNRIV
jgi:ligand-binding sensor protein/AraC-like DNA-binding protein